MSDGDFEPEGWSAFDDHGTQDEKGYAGCDFASFAVASIKIAGEESDLKIVKHELRTWD